MTLASFRKRCWAMAKSEGTPFLKPTDAEEWHDLVQEGLDAYTEGTHCLQADNVVFTPIANYSSYDTGQTSIVVSGVTTTYLTYRLCYVRQVVINGSYLQSHRDIYGRPGPSSEYQMTGQNQGYLASSAGQPAFWWQEPPNTLRFDKAFDQSYGSCYLAGRRYHSLYTANDQVAIELASEDIEAAALLVASKLLMPNAKDKAMALRQAAEVFMKKRRATCEEKLFAGSQRGTGNAQQSVNLVYGGAGGGSPRRYRS